MSSEVGSGPEAAGPEIRFFCPADMRFWSEKVFAGEYALPQDCGLPSAPTIIDAGANCGAFALWAAHAWPEATIFAYEPTQVAFAHLAENVRPYGERIRILRAAILSEHSERTKLYCGLTNQGEASFWPELGQTTDTYELPPIVRPAELPRADILKVDTEGCEREIIGELLLLGQRPKAVLFEYHSEKDRRALDEMLAALGYELCGGLIAAAGRGTLKYLRAGTAGTGTGSATEGETK